MNLLTSPNQTAFIKGRFILESVVSAHEVIHIVAKDKAKGVVLKLDHEKAFDKVNLDFLDELLSKRNFSPTFRKLIGLITRGGSVDVKINGVEGNFFTTGRGLHQGDPLSPLLFNFVVDIFTRMLSKVASHNLVRGLCREHVPGGVLSLQYADDTILFMENNLEMARNLKWVLSCFEQVSGMKVNYNKSELVPINLEPEEIDCFREIFDCAIGSFPIKYLGVPLHHDKLKREDLQPIIDKILKRIAGWRGKLLLMQLEFS
jgi:mannosylglycoprotein endo-beta-mannosidase